MICLNVLSTIILIFQEIFEKIVNGIERKKYVPIGIILSVFVVCAIVFLFFFRSGVNAEENEMLHKYYTVVTIEEGNSLWSYADVYATLGFANKAEFINEVQFINHLDDVNEIVIGKKIVLPYYSYEVL